MRSDDWDEALLVEHRQFIGEKRVKEAFDELVSKAIENQSFSVKPAWHGQLRDFRYFDLGRKVQPFAFSVNRGHLLFYIRKPGWVRVSGKLFALRKHFASISELKSGEWTIRIESKEEAAQVNRLLLEPSRANVATKHEPGASEKAKPIGGNADYQQRARRALPMLVDCARARKTISYKDLARRLQMPNPRNLNYVLGSVGITLVHLGELWGESIPPITTLVVRSGSTLPGIGADIFFSSDDGLPAADNDDRQSDVDSANDSVFEYSEWDRVLQALNLIPHGTLNAGLTAFLLSWNPDRFSWNSLSQEIEQLRNGESVRERWSCGNRTDLPVGSRIFLVRLGQAPKGIVGRAEALSEPYEAEHWDLDKRREGLKARYIDLRFTDLYQTPLVSWDELQHAPFSAFNWSIMASGVQLPLSIAGELDRRFEMNHEQGASSVTALTPDLVLAAHPFEKEIAEELAILNAADIPSTDKVQLIVARRGQGKFRDNVLVLEPKCRITKVQDPRCLIASHIKPWSQSTNMERLNGNNGLMLAPHVDRLFDEGLISFTDFGDLLISPKCPTDALNAWGIAPICNVGPFRAQQRPFLAFHRKLHGFAG